jgi:alkaline phosphatase D
MQLAIMIKVLLFLFILMGSIGAQAQNFDVEIGPIYGHYTDSTQNFWILVNPHGQNDLTVDWVTEFTADLYQYFGQSTDGTIKKINHSAIVEDIFIMVSGVLALDKPKEKKQDISFLVGSCAFPYPFLFWGGKDKEVIYNTMRNHNKDFMLWMGDNVYYLFGEWKSKRKMHRKNLKMRFKPSLKSFLESCPQYATWDDHDYGPNNAGGTNSSKYETLEMFKKYWGNPYYGLDTLPGVFSHFSQSDADFFLLDSRFYANDTSMLGVQQMRWLKEKLKASKANFKFIISGTQILADNPTGEDLGDFGTAREKMLTFLEKEHITGVIFLSGDRHYGELMKLDREGTYPLYEMTSSPLTSIVNPGPTKNNKLRLPKTLVLDLNFGKVHLFGNNETRRCRLELFDKEGNLFWQHDVFLSELQ